MPLLCMRIHKNNFQMSHKQHEAYFNIFISTIYSFTYAFIHDLCCCHSIYENPLNLLLQFANPNDDDFKIDGALENYKDEQQST